MCGMAYYCDDSFYAPVPLTKVHLAAKVVNFTACVEITQEFVNKEKNPIECVYFFPVEEEAAVVDFTAEIEGRKVVTKVKEKEDAREEYNEAVANRQTAFLLEETKADIFEIKVGHLSPGAGCKIKITYLSELPVEEGKTKLTIPTTVAPRYVPLSDGSQQAKKIASIQHDFSSPVKMDMNLQVLMMTEILTIMSPTHSLTDPVKKKHQGYFVADVEFVGSNTDMDRDMVIYVESEEPRQPRVCIEKNDEGSCVAMLSVVPDFKIPDNQIEAVFLVDCSGSMSGESIRLAKKALQVFLHSLPPTSFFNIILFGSTFEYLFPHSKKYDDDTLKDAKESSASISANLGGTEIYQPLEHILKQPLLAGLARQVFVLTDGQVSNTSACIDLVRKYSNKNRVFTLGIGSSADRHLVKGMARAGMGTSVFTSQGESLTAKVINQLKNALQPCINDVSVRWGKTNTFEGSGEATDIVETKKTLFGFGKPIKQIATKFSINSQVPSMIPPIYDGSRLVAYKLIGDNLGDITEVTVKAKTPEGDLEVTLPISKDNFIHGNSVHQLFARKMIQEAEEVCEKDHPAESKKLITELGLKYNLASKYTSFVGVGEKQSKSKELMMRRHVKNQLPNNFGSSSIIDRGICFAVVDSATRSKGLRTKSLFSTSNMPPPGAAPPRMAKNSRSTSSLFGGTKKVKSAPSRDTFACGGGPAPPPRMAKDSMPPPGAASPRRSLGSTAMRGVCVTDRVEESVTPVANPVHSLTLSQAANGSFPEAQSVANILGVDVQEMMEAGGASKEDKVFMTVWVTMVVMVFLKENCQEEREVWDLVFEKAKKWLENNGAASLPELQQKAKQFVKNLKF